MQDLSKFLCQAQSMLVWCGYVAWLDTYIQFATKQLDSPQILHMLPVVCNNNQKYVAVQ